jgi:prolyl-tRNA editing enzyme YbaK/EbsC (Cys-tRNA(Pro) deacylase)
MSRENPSVIRVIETLKELKIGGDVVHLSDSARSAQEAADALNILVGQVASSIVFKLPDGSPLLVITSGRHRVNTELVAEKLGVTKLHRADADYVKESSGFSIGGVSPVGWIKKPTIVIDQALDEYEIIWAAAGHPHTVFPTTYSQLCSATAGKPMVVGD